MADITKDGTTNGSTSHPSKKYRMQLVIDPVHRALLCAVSQYRYSLVMISFSWVRVKYSPILILCNGNVSAKAQVILSTVMVCTTIKFKIKLTD